MDSNFALTVNQITKKYQDHLAVDQVSFSVEKGSIFGMLGPNGAGKTSIIRMITSITHPDQGEILFFGDSLKFSDRLKIGYMPEERGLYKKMSVADQLIYLCRLKGVGLADAKKRLDYWADKLDFGSWMKKNVEDLSKGMQQKIQFVSTVMHEPELLILDEPFSGLDPVNANIIEKQIVELNQKGTTIIFSTHRMEQVEQFCQEIVLINKGKNILEGNVSQIRNEKKEGLYELEWIPKELLPDFADVKLEWMHDSKIKFYAPDIESANRIVLNLLQHDYQVQSFHEILPTLNEIFIKAVKQIQ
jgi:ABC-2 type transport system ATP-binding protein